jgi:glyoxalase/bleomycin resistance protein/dioxygenase superfamily protein
MNRKYDVGGVLLDRPFKIRRLGHFGYNVENVAGCLEFYCELLGFRRTSRCTTRRVPS